MLRFNRSHVIFLQLVPFALKHRGYAFGTSKQAYHNARAFDQSDISWDKREFLAKERTRVVERKSFPIKDTNLKKMGKLTSIFFRNGWGRSILMQLTLPNHQCNE